MSSNRRGFATLLLLGVVAALLLVGAYAYGKYENSGPTPGASIQTQLTDTIGTFRTNVNTNFSNIDSEIASVTGTQATYGNLVTLNSPLPVANGGTGTTTAPSNSQFLSASGTQPTWKTLTFGGGLLSTTTGTTVNLSASGFDTTQNYTLTGNWIFSTSTLFNGSSTFTSTTTFTGSVTSPYLAPPGVIEAYASSSAPSGWLLANGQSISTSTYPNLFAVIGYTYGGSTSTFNLPNLSGRVIFGPSANESTTIGATGGAVTTTASVTVTGPNWGPNGGGSVAQQGTYVSSPFSIIPSYIVMQYIIKF